MPAKLIGTLTREYKTQYPNQTGSIEYTAKVRLYWDRAILTIDRYHPYTSRTNPNSKTRVLFTEAAGWTRIEERMRTDQRPHLRPIKEIHYCFEPKEVWGNAYRWSIRLVDHKLPKPEITLTVDPSYIPGDHYFLMQYRLDPTDPNVQQVINALKKHFGDA